MAFIGKQPTPSPLTASDITDAIITNAKLAQDIISGETELATAPAATDELLVSDAGVLKRVDVSLVGGTNTPIVSVDMTGSDPAISSGAYTKIQMNTERVDTDNAFDNSSNYTFTVPSGKAGKYFMIGFARISALNGTSDFAVLQLANSGRSTVYNSNIQSGNSGYGYAAITVSCARDLSVGDTVSLFAYGSEGINIADGNCNLTVYKLIA